MKIPGGESVWTAVPAWLSHLGPTWSALCSLHLQHKGTKGTGGLGRRHPKLHKNRGALLGLHLSRVKEAVGKGHSQRV